MEQKQEQGQSFCRLAHLFELQKKFCRRLGIEPDTLSDEERKDWVLSYARAMQQEIAELVDSLPWKWWAKYQQFDLQNARVEVVDVLHFLISTAIALGMNADDLYEKFCKKNEVNHMRQDAGYAEKDRDDARHI
ncbi:MAG: dUTPase [Puniceicoccales bacterium]|jgi:dimeric dUTPase (all-alpha-NTP-PPase superfamily)|nr:dUTPase [Puniceicoccales bacterium]